MKAELDRFLEEGETAAKVADSSVCVMIFFEAVERYYQGDFVGFVEFFEPVRRAVGNNLDEYPALRHFVHEARKNAQEHDFATAKSDTGEFVGFLVALDKIDDRLRGQNVTGFGGVADFAAEVAFFERGDIQVLQYLFSML